MESSGRIVSGYAIRWYSLSKELYDVEKGEYFKEMFTKNSLAESLRSKDQYLVYAHDPDKIVAQVGQYDFSMVIDKTGLFFSAKMPDTPLGNRILREVRIGYIKNISIGFIPSNEESLVVGNQKFRIIHKAELREISFVHLPAYTDTVVNINGTVVEELITKIKIALDGK